VLKTTPAPVLFKNIHSWSCSGSCWKSRTPAGVEWLRYSGSCTPLFWTYIRVATSWKSPGFFCCPGKSL